MTEDGVTVEMLQQAVEEAVSAYEGLLQDHVKVMNEKNDKERRLQKQVEALQGEKNAYIESLGRAHAEIHTLKKQVYESRRCSESHKSSELYKSKRQCAALNEKLAKQKEANTEQEAVVRSAFAQIDALLKTERSLLRTESRMMCKTVYMAAVRNAFEVVKWGFDQWSDVVEKASSKPPQHDKAPEDDDASSFGEVLDSSSSESEHVASTTEEDTLYTEEASSTASADEEVVGGGEVVESSAPPSPAAPPQNQKKALRKQRNRERMEVALSHSKKAGLLKFWRRWHAAASMTRLVEFFGAWRKVVVDKTSNSLERVLAVVSGTEEPSESSRLGIESAIETWFGGGAAPPPPLSFQVMDRMYRTEHMKLLNAKERSMDDSIITVTDVVVMEVREGPYTYVDVGEEEHYCEFGAVLMSDGGLYKIRRADERDMLLAVFVHREPLELLPLWVGRCHPGAANVFQERMAFKTDEHGKMQLIDDHGKVQWSVDVKWLDGKVQPNLPVKFHADKICEVNCGKLVECTHNGQTFPVRVVSGDVSLSGDEDVTPEDAVQAGDLIVTRNGVTFVQPELVPDHRLGRLQVVSASDEVVEVKVSGKGKKSRCPERRFRFAQVRKADLTSPCIRYQGCDNKWDVISWLVQLCDGKPDSKVISRVCDMARENFRQLEPNSTCHWVPNSQLLEFALNLCCSDEPNEDFLKVIWEIVSAIQPDNDRLACIWANFHVRADVETLKQMYNCIAKSPDYVGDNEVSSIVVTVPQWVALFASKFSQETLRSFNLLATSNLPETSLSIKWNPLHILTTCMNETVLNILRIRKFRAIEMHPLLKRINRAEMAFLWFCETTEGLDVTLDGEQFVAEKDGLTHKVKASDWIHSSPPDGCTLVVHEVTESTVVFVSEGGKKHQMRNPKTPCSFPLEAELHEAQEKEEHVQRKVRMHSLLAAARNQWKVLCEIRTREREETTTPCLCLRM